MSSSRDIRDFATIVREGQVIREGCRVQSRRRGSVKSYDEKNMLER